MSDGFPSGVYTIQSAAGFLPSLAKALSEALPGPEALGRLTVLTPNRRAGRALADAFAALDDASPAALLPVIRPLGDVDADEPPFEPGELADLAPPAISAARRRFELARLVLEKERALGRRIGAGGALALADDLARLIDDLHTEETADLSRIDAEVRAALPAHMQEAALFLDIVMEHWPARLAELNRVDPAKRRSVLLNALAERWRERPPEGPVVAAGSTGSIPAAANVLSVVAGLPRGAVVLPGFAHDMDDATWDAIDDAHPQQSMKRLIERIGVDRSAVKTFPGAPKEGLRAAARRRVLTEALRPAETTGDWLNAVAQLKEGRGPDVFETALDGLSVIEAPGPAEEARAVALALRETLETPGRTALVVTPDRMLARRIAVEASRFGVTLDDSAGRPLSDTAVGTFLLRVMDAALDPGSALGFAALAASPLFALGRDRASLRPILGALERAALRGRRPGERFDALIARAREAAGEDAALAERWTALLETTRAALAPLTALKGEQPAAAWAEALCRAAEALSGDEARPGPDRLWSGEAGEDAAALVREFLEESEALAPLPGTEFRRALLETARARRVRPRFGAHPRLQILGPLEARLARADRVILSGLNEGTWPARPGGDPFVSRGMRLAAGLSAPERRFGLAAHDFAELAGMGEVILTRALKDEGAPTVASRWLQRLQTLARGALGAEAADRLLHPDTDYLALGRLLDAPEAPSAIAPPAPRPPVEARPRRLSVTRIETWVRDPYSIYARYVLGLRKLDPLDRPAGPPERGQAWHAAFERFARSLPDTDTLPVDAETRLYAEGETALAEAGFTPAELGLERVRFRRAARAFLMWEAHQRIGEARPAALEAAGELAVAAPAGPFTLTARADRIDIRADGGLDVIDFKTGRAPGRKEVAAGFAPQLPLTAAIAARGGFADAPSHEPGALVYLRITGGVDPGGEVLIAEGDAAVDMAEEALDRLEAWIAFYDDPDTPYLSQPRSKYMNDYGDYDHLARREEWASAGGGEE